MGPERKLYQDFKKKAPQLILNRIENLSLIGMPDVLGYNKNNHFFTIEFKVTKGKKIRFSPHQIAWHKTHPENTFILLRTLGPRSEKPFSDFLYRGSRITELVACGLSLEACCLGLDSSISLLESLGA
ncbi:MAG: hypothetical protein CL508_00115 [Actinobacteria bacterium]|nr:hypothetical protein [Actinomycetota bacterium]